MADKHSVPLRPTSDNISTFNTEERDMFAFQADQLRQLLDPEYSDRFPAPSANARDDVQLLAESATRRTARGAVDALMLLGRLETFEQQLVALMNDLRRLAPSLMVLQGESQPG